MRPWPYPIRQSTPGMTAGAASDGAKYFPGLSALGRGMLVIFALLSTLGARDLALAKVSFDQLTSSIEGISYLPSISAHGTRIAFVSTADLKPGVPGNTDGSNELFLWSQGTGITRLTNSWAATMLQPSISADGTKIALVSSADFTGGNADLLPELFLWTQGVGFTQLTNTTGGLGVFEASISADGTKIAFISNADLFLWTSGSGITQITNSAGLDSGNGGPSINADSTRIAFVSSSNLTGGNPDGNQEIFLAKLSRNMAQKLVVNGFTLNGNEEKWVRFVGGLVVPQLLGDRNDKIRVAARASWWALKEGTFSLSKPIAHSVCNSIKNGKSKDVPLKPLEICDPGRAWQVGLAAVQVPNFTEQEVLDTVQALWPGRAVTDVLAETALLAGFDPSKGTGAAIVASTSVLRKSWLLRNPAVGLTLVERNVTDECVNGARGWCYGSDWKTTEKYAPTRDAAMQSIADLIAIFSVIAP